MTKKFWGAFFGLSLVAPSVRAERSLNELLGFDKSDRVLILQTDDLGVLSSVDEGARQLFRTGNVCTGTVITNAPGAQAAVRKLHESCDDLGVHLSLVSEWPRVPWGPLTDSPSLKNKIGDFFPNPLELLLHARSVEVAAEFEAQIKRFISWGFQPTHLDSHMGGAFLRPAWLRAYLTVAKKYRLPPLIPRWSAELRRQSGSFARLGDLLLPNVVSKIEKAGFYPIDALYALEHPANYEGYEVRKAHYLRILKSLGPGTSQILIHPAILDDEFQTKVLQDFPEQKLRVDELKIFQDPEILNLIRDKKIHLVGWKKIQEVYPWNDIKNIPGFFELFNPLR